MRSKIVRLIIGVLAATAFADTKSRDLVIATAPNNEFQLVSQSERSAVWLVTTKNPDQRVALPPGEIEKVDSSAITEPQLPHPPARIIKVSSDSLEISPRCFISPDSRWIFLQVGGWEGWTGLLYRKIGNSLGESAPRFEQASSEGFEKAAWHFFSREMKVAEDLVGIANQYGTRFKALRFAGWSADSGRLLVELSGSIGKPREPKGGGPTEYDANVSRLCYFNTRTGDFERTERLRKADAKKAPQRELDDKSAEVNAVLEAESIGQESPEIPAPERFKKADTDLNNVYQALLKSLPPDQKTELQDGQRSWLMERDTFAAIHANQSWSPFPNASRIEGAAIFTESRVAELKKRLDAAKKP
jgi:uncharacterized protein YecT (DUF1311 family)